MTLTEFNTKYRDFITKGYNGLTIPFPEVIEYLDEKFEVYTKDPTFTYSLIEYTYNRVRIYCNLIEGEIRHLQDECHRLIDIRLNKIKEYEQ